MTASAVGQLRSLPAAPALLMASGMGAALLLQHVLDWLPCPLCIVQRLTALSLVVLLSGWALAERSDLARRIWLGAAAIAAFAGVAAAGAHLWLLWQPQTGACGPGLARWVNHLVEALPGSEWLLEGAGACDEAKYALIGIPLPAWSGALHLAALAWAFGIRRKN